MEDLFVKSLPLIGVLIGASLQYLYSKLSEKYRHNRTIRMDAYLEYLTAVGEMEALNINPSVENVAAATGKAISAKVKVCAYGTSKAVKALSNFEGHQDKNLSESKKRALNEFINVIRTEGGVADTRIDHETINQVLYGKSQNA